MTADVAQEEFKDVLAWWKELLGAAVGQVDILAQSPTPSHCYTMLFLPRDKLRPADKAATSLPLVGLARSINKTQLTMGKVCSVYIPSPAAGTKSLYSGEL